LSLDRCLFLARIAHESERPELERRVLRLARFHGGRASWRWAGELAAGGSVRPDGAIEDLDAPLVFGEPLPADLGRSDRLIDASKAKLRAIDGATAALALDGDRACIVAGAGGPGMLYHAMSGPIEAWSTHAVAAGWLASGEVAVDPSALPVQIAADFVGGARTLLRDVRALPRRCGSPRARTGRRDPTSGRSPSAGRPWTSRTRTAT